LKTCIEKFEEHVLDELLESIWTSRENGKPSISECLASAHAQVSQEHLDRLVELELASLHKDQVRLTEAGESRAAGIIRRHRLAERLVVDVLGLTPEQSEEMACNFEHAVVPEVVDGICTLLGHPTECPHGKPIPPGLDCQQGVTEVTRMLRRLSEVPCSGEPVRVAYLRTGNHDRLHHLLSLGFSPGTELLVHQRTPVLVVQLDQSEFALDEEVAEDVYVWADSNPS
jgi:DtxR family Mn-dependent transcriptional regulator